MGDRRSFDRRAPEKGVLKIRVKSFIIYTILLACITALSITSITLFNKNKEYKKIISEYEGMYYDMYSDNQDIMEDSNEDSINNEW